jgi:hypothetical protein
MLKVQMPIGKFDYNKFFKDYPTAYLDTFINDNSDRTTIIVYDDGIEYENYQYALYGYYHLYHITVRIQECMTNYEINSVQERLDSYPQEVKDLFNKFLELPEVQRLLEEERQRKEKNKKIGDIFNLAQKKFEDEVEKYIIKD